MAWLKVKDKEGKEYLVPENALKDVYPKGIFTKFGSSSIEKEKKKTEEQKR